MAGSAPPEVTRLRTPAERSVPGAWIALALLILINLFNFIDRQMLAAVEPEVREALLISVDPDAESARFYSGLLAMAFLVTYMLFSPVFGMLAERYPRWLLIAIGVTVWSLASGASGLATAFGVMLLTRCLVGIGEAAYAPVAPALIADLFPVSKRGQVLAWFYLAMPVGGALGYALGGQMAKIDPAAESWRWAFYAVVAPGLLLALWAFLMRDPPRGAADALAAAPRRPSFRDYLVLLRNKSYAIDTAGMTAMSFAMGALAWWVPDYLKTHEVPPAFGAIEPRTFFGILTAAAGLTGTLAGGIAGDWLRPRMPGSYFFVSGAGLLITAPCIIGFLLVPFPAAWFFVFLSVFFIFFNTGPSNTILANVTHPSLRPTGFALNILIMHLFGDAISPFIVGGIADYVNWRYDTTAGLSYAFAAVSAFLVLGGLVWLWGTKHLERDTANAVRQLD